MRMPVTSVWGDAALYRSEGGHDDVSLTQEPDTVVQALGSLRQEGQEFKASLSDI